MPDREGGELRANALGLLAAAALTAAYMAPALSVYALFGPMVSQVGISVGFVMLLGLLMTLPSAVSFGVMAKEMPSAGGVYAWANRALGPAAGAWVGITTATYYIITVFFPPIVFGQFLNDCLSGLGVAPTKWTWLAGAVLSLIVTGSVTYRGIVVSSRLAFAMLMTELAVVVALGLTFLGGAILDGRFSFDPVLPAAAKGGWSSIFLALPLALLSMICDASTPTSEETREAKRTIPLAVVLPCILVGIWYVVGFSAFALAAPREKIFALTSAEFGNPITPLAKAAWGPFEILVRITGMTAAIGALVPCSTAASRVLFAMGRDGRLPAWLGRVHSGSKAPRNALHVVYGATALAVIPVALAVGDVPAITWWGNVIGWYIAAVYIAANLSNIVYHARFLRGRFHIVWNLLVPVAGIAVQTVVIGHVVIAELWKKEWFGRSAQLLIALAAIASAIYAVRAPAPVSLPDPTPRSGGASPARPEGPRAES